MSTFDEIAEGFDESELMKDIALRNQEVEKHLRGIAASQHVIARCAIISASVGYGPNMEGLSDKDADALSDMLDQNKPEVV